MTKATKETTALMRRVVSRTLLVLGGAVVTTAAAWALSSSSASADTPDVFGTFPVEPVAPVAAPAEIPVVSDIVDSLGRLIGDPDPDFGDEAKKAFDEFGREIAERFDVTPNAPVDQIDGVDDVTLPEITLPGTGSRDGSTVAPPAAGQPVAKATTLVGVRPGATEHTAEADATDRAQLGGMNRRGSPQTSDEAPAAPFGPSPLAPLTFPAPVGSGHTGTGSVDAPSFGLLSSVPTGTDLFPAAASSRPAKNFVPVTVGAQPGVTPD